MNTLSFIIVAVILFTFCSTMLSRDSIDLDGLPANARMKGCGDIRSTLGASATRTTLTPCAAKYDHLRSWSIHADMHWMAIESASRKTNVGQQMTEVGPTYLYTGDTQPACRPITPTRYSTEMGNRLRARVCDS